MHDIYSYRSRISETKYREVIMLLSVDLNAAQVSKYPTGYAGMDIDIRKINIIS